MFAKRSWHIDIPLLMSLLIVIGYGMLVLYSASGQNQPFMLKQVVRTVMGFGVLILCAQIPPRVYYRLAPWLYWAGIIMLLLVLAFSMAHKGAHRWLDLKVVRFQPAELMKIAVPLMLARYLNDRTLPPTFQTLCLCLGMIMLPGLLIAKQPDLGTSLLITSSGLFVLFFAGIGWRWIVGALVTVLTMIPVAWHFLMHGYQKRRVITFLNPEHDPLGSGYHIIQSKIAIGSGGLWGQGFLAGSQSQLRFLPERHTDFIFAVLGEEFGLIGAVILLLMYCLVLLRGGWICYQADQTFTRLLGASMMSTFFVYIFVNIGMVCGVLPIVGLPLPLMSYGGTALVTLMAGFGILMSIHTHKRRL